MTPISPDVNPFTLALLALLGLAVFGWLLLVPGGAPTPIG